MKRIPLAELERRCQKPDHRRLGNWMARRISRPAALRITRVVAPWGISANLATLVAWATGAAAAAAFAWGTVWGWVLGGALLELWYLLDHVDGQLARLRGTASLDGVQLDYLMHHTINLLVPLGVGCGLFAATAQPLWAAGGLLWAVSSLLITLHHDARYKAFIQRLKCVRGQLHVHGGGGLGGWWSAGTDAKRWSRRPQQVRLGARSARPQPPDLDQEARLGARSARPQPPHPDQQARLGARSARPQPPARPRPPAQPHAPARPQPPGRPLRLLAWTARKACEIHVVLNVLALIAVGQLLAGDWELLTGRVYLALIVPTAAAVAAWTIFRSQQRGSAEREFAAWFRVPPGHELVFCEGWWTVQPAQDGKTGEMTKYK
jgi:hypothetical protein